MQEIGFLTPKPVIYVANLPLEAVTPEVSDDPQDAVKEVSESAAAIAKVALAHAETIVGLNREYGVPAIAACLRDRGGQEALGATVRYYLLLLHGTGLSNHVCVFQPSELKYNVKLCRRAVDANRSIFTMVPFSRVSYFVFAARFCSSTVLDAHCPSSELYRYSQHTLLSQ